MSNIDKSKDMIRVVYRPIELDINLPGNKNSSL